MTVTFLLMVLSGVLIVLPFSYPQLYILSWGALIPALYGLENSSLKQSFFQSWIMGITIVIGSGYWLYFPLKYHSSLSIVPVMLILVLLFLLVGSIYGLWGLAYKFLQGEGRSVKPLYLAVSWAGIEFLRSMLIPIFSFGFMGNTQISFKSFLQLADIGGVFLLSFIVILVNGFLYSFLKTRKKRNIIVLIVILVLIFGYGNYRLNYYNDKDYDTIKVGLVQTDIPQEKKWLHENITDSMNNLLDRAAEVKTADLIVFPETSLTFDLMAEENYRQIFAREIKSFSNYIQVGSLAVQNNSKNIYNSVFLFSPANKIIGRYNKLNLVPFGEYMPYPDLIQLITGVTMDSQQPGKEVSLFTAPFASWRTVICSEILDSAAIQSKINSVDFIVNQSNEAWFGDTNLQNQMWGAAILRAVENRRSVVRTGNHAINGLISPAGTNILKTNLGDTDSYTVAVQKNRETTFYHKWGDLTGPLFFWLMLLIIIIVFKVNRS